MAKVVGAWYTMEVTEVETISSHLDKCKGNILDTNFISKSVKEFTCPLLRTPRLISPGDVIKMVYFVSEQDLENFRNNKTYGFLDRGLRCFVKNGIGSWDLLFSDDE